MDAGSGRQTSPRYVLERGPLDRAGDELHLALSDRIRRRDIYAFVEIPDPAGAGSPSRPHPPEMTRSTAAPMRRGGAAPAPPRPPAVDADGRGRRLALGGERWAPAHRIGVSR